MLPSWAIGVIICVLGSAMCSVGWILQKYSHSRNQELPQHMQKTYYQQHFWLLGFVVNGIGNLGDVIALAFAAQSLVAPLGSVVLVVNAIMSPWVLKETITSQDIKAVVLMIVGDVLVVLGASHEDTSYSLEELGNFFTRPAFLIFLIGTLVFCLFLALKKDQLDWKLDPKRESSNNAKDTENSGSNNSTTENTTQWRILESISRLVNVSDQMMHPYTYAALAGIVGGLLLLLAKCIAELVKVSVERDSSQFHSPIFWILAVLLIVAWIAQVHWINQGLERYDSFYIVPMFHIHWNIWSILGGILFFDEFQTFTAVNYVLFLLGVTFIFVGMAYLSQREMQNQTHINKSQEVLDSETASLIPSKTADTVQ